VATITSTCGPAPPHISNGNASFYAVGITQFNISNGQAILNIYKNTVPNSLTIVASTTIYGCHNGMVVRAVMNQANAVVVFIVRTFAGDFMVQTIRESFTIETQNGVKFQRNDVSFNGDAGMWNPDGTPRLHLCGQP
jgi:hypothetical protein